MENQSPVLIICGPTSTGKTGLAFQLSKLIPIEIISADSRQVYKHVNISTGIDVPAGSKSVKTDLIWHNEPLQKIITDSTSIWLQDMVEPIVDFNLSFWHECANLVITNIQSRNLTPVIVGNTGLYIKSITDNLSQIHIPQNEQLRNQYQNSSAIDLFQVLKKINPDKANSLNNSDKANPRRLIRAIEVSQAKKEVPTLPKFKTISVCLYCSLETAKKRIADRITSRLNQGVESEARQLLNCPNQTILNITGIKVWHDGWRNNESREEIISNWHHQELLEFKKQLTWFKNHSYDYRIDTDSPNWQSQALQMLRSI